MRQEVAPRLRPGGAPARSYGDRVLLLLKMNGATERQMAEARIERLVELLRRRGVPELDAACRLLPLLGRQS